VAKVSEWPAVVVALGILILLGGVLVTATARWTAADLKDVIGTLAPVLGVVTGAFVTYFFTRQANMAATNASLSAADAAVDQAASAKKELAGQIERSQALHNALTAVLSMTDVDTARIMRSDPIVSAALNSHRTGDNGDRA
jgi:uncharacterized membrane protein HdeD (DUF308 family)